MAAETNIPASPCQPLLKWAGGKRWLANAVVPLISNPKTRLIEPFAGSAACFFASDVSRVILGDINDDLIRMYEAVRDTPESVYRNLSRHRLNKNTFKKLRHCKGRSKPSGAARLIFLNKAAFNGLYRVNAKGEFNVPYGRKRTTQLPTRKHLFAISRKLRNSILISGGFLKTLSLANPQDVLFVDPPYTVKHNNNCFRRYNEKIFSWEDQRRLAKELTFMARASTRVIVTNAFHPEVLKIYPKRWFNAYSISRCSNMAAAIEHRGRTHELLLVSKHPSWPKRELKKILCESFPLRLKQVW